MKTLLALLMILSAPALRAQFVFGADVKTETIYYDTTRIAVHLKAKDTTVYIKVLGVHPEAVQRFASVNDVPVRLVKYYSSWEVKPSDVGTCALPCSSELKPRLKVLIAQEIERKRLSIEARERFIDSLFPPKRASKLKAKK